MLNYGIFLLQMAAMVCFTNALARLRESGGGGWLLDGTLLRYTGLALLVIASQRELSLGRVRPDALLQALLLFAVAALLTHLRTGLLRYAVHHGPRARGGLSDQVIRVSFWVWCAWLALVAFRWSTGERERLAACDCTAGVLAFCCFAAIAGPYVAALSRQKGRFDFGDSGALNYAWYVAGTEKMHLEPWQTDKFGAAKVDLKHPEKQLMADPGIYSYAALPIRNVPGLVRPDVFQRAHRPAHRGHRRDSPRRPQRRPRAPLPAEPSRAPGPARPARVSRGWGSVRLAPRGRTLSGSYPPALGVVLFASSTAR